MDDLETQVEEQIIHPEKLDNEKLNPFERLQKQLTLFRSNLLLILSPGNKQFKDLSKRIRLMLISFLIPSILLILKVYIFESATQIYLWLGISFGLSVLAYFFTLWALKFYIRKESFLSVMNLVPAYVFTMSLFITLLFLGPLERVYILLIFFITIAIFMMGLYILLLSVNVMNVNLFYVIPLSKLAETLGYFYSIASIFFLSYSCSSMVIHAVRTADWLLLVASIITAFLVSAIIFFSSIYYYTPVQGGGLSFALLLAVITCFSMITFTFFLPYIVMVGVFASLEVYVLLGILIHKTQNTLKPQIYAEYLIIFVAALLIIIIL